MNDERVHGLLMNHLIIIFTLRGVCYMNDERVHGVLMNHLIIIFTLRGVCYMNDERVHGVLMNHLIIIFTLRGVCYMNDERVHGVLINHLIIIFTLRGVCYMNDERVHGVLIIIYDRSYKEPVLPWDSLTPMHDYMRFYSDCFFLENVVALKRAVDCGWLVRLPSLRNRTECGPASSTRTRHPWRWRSCVWRARSKLLHHGWHSRGTPSGLRVFLRIWDLRFSWPHLAWQVVGLQAW